MRRLLPYLIILFIFFSFIFGGQKVFAQPQTPTTTPTITLTPAPTSVSLPPQQIWNSDSEVTFVGKVGARSGAFLDWTLREYQWASMTSALRSFWRVIFNIVAALSLVFVLVTAFVMIISRGRSITIMRFVPRFVLIILLVTFSFSLIQAIYEVGDIVQGFFLKDPDGNVIQQDDLLYIGFNYETFEGYRLAGYTNDESAFISLLLVKLTAITYYAMTGILLLRKVILWFFIIIAPIFPLLLLYSPIRNTGKIWIGEFFRWVLYAPIFAIFLSGVVTLWRSGTTILPGIPLNFRNIGDAYLDPPKVVFPTAINILLGGPGQKLSIANSVNITDTFALYVVALLMLWVVILLPFLLLQIFLDYLHSFSFTEMALYKQIMSTSSPFLNKYGFGGAPPPAPTTPPAPMGPASAGMAKALPYGAKIEIPQERRADISDINKIADSQIRSSSQLIRSQIARFAQQNQQLFNLTNLSLPTMRDVARFETASLSRDVSRHQEVASVHEKLEKIANPGLVSTSVERDKYIKIKENLVQAKQSGNPVAVSILSAAGQVSKAATGVKLASAVAFPTANRVQQVSLDDYEAVKKMWKENYQKLEPPKNINGIELNRKEWIKQEIGVITQTINYLSSNNQQKINQGMEMVSKILPFLLIGGFSNEEVIAYLKAKLEAAKGTLEEMEKQQEEEETTIDVKHEKTEKPKEMTMEEKAEVEKTEIQAESPSKPEEVNNDGQNSS